MIIIMMIMKVSLLPSEELFCKVINSGFIKKVDIVEVL